MTPEEAAGEEGAQTKEDHQTSSAEEDPFDEEPDFDDWDEEESDAIADPLEPINRVFFHFNDKLYFWVLKPVATGYKTVAPERVRIGVRNFFRNLLMPVRAVNCLLQGKVDGLGSEIGRFMINSTVGVLGFMDPAEKWCHLGAMEEDFGQTLGFFGLGPGIYINWPILGPSSLRDSVGIAGDSFLNPINYMVEPTKYSLATKGYEQVNKTSLSIGNYESVKEAALDPYVSLRDAYHQYRTNKIKE
ncbi:MAG: VacJ family lipoprotein [Desulfatiglans sp.]|nr:VacJ family lipoprotein [Thermodesulfobacteriota bacterium]MEE4352380.1 VacJ family lipoprotein [Desulfatiglans sp.]